MEISKMLTLSTAHITEQTAIGLEKATKSAEPDLDLCVYTKEGYGFFIHIPDDWQDGRNIPPDLRDCMELADSHNCKWLCLDRDGDVTEKLQVYVWGE